jgi:hypothetical protein
MKFMKYSGLLRPIIAMAIPVFLALGGCASQQHSIAPPATPEQLAAIRDEYRGSDPMARVGQVTDVLQSDHLALVGSVSVKDFAVGDVITFLDSNRQVLTLGTVEAINRSNITVRYEPPDKTGREPVIGDLAVRAIK